MASIIKRKRNNRTTYLAFVRRKGVKAIVKSFYNKTDAKKWARVMERKLDKGDFSDYSEASKLTLGDLLERYIEEGKHSTKKDKKNIEYNPNINIENIASPKKVVPQKEANAKQVIPPLEARVFDVGVSMATFTMVGVLKSQKHYRQALAVLSRLEEKGADVKRITTERIELELLLSAE